MVSSLAENELLIPLIIVLGGLFFAMFGLLLCTCAMLVKPEFKNYLQRQQQKKQTAKKGQTVKSQRINGSKQMASIEPATVTNQPIAIDEEQCTQNEITIDNTDEVNRNDQKEIGKMCSNNAQKQQQSAIQANNDIKYDPVMVKQDVKMAKEMLSPKPKDIRINIRTIDSDSASKFKIDQVLSSNREALSKSLLPSRPNGNTMIAHFYSEDAVIVKSNSE